MDDQNFPICMCSPLLAGVGSSKQETTPKNIQEEGHVVQRADAAIEKSKCDSLCQLRFIFYSNLAASIR